MKKFLSAVGGIRSRPKYVLSFEEAERRLGSGQVKELGECFRSCTEQRDLGGKLKRGPFQRCGALRERGIIHEGDKKYVVDSVFKGFDADGKGYISWEEFVVGVAVTTDGTPTERLKFTLRMYDVENSGFVTKSDLTKLYVAIAKEDGLIQGGRRQRLPSGKRRDVDLRQEIGDIVDDIFSRYGEQYPNYERMHYFAFKRFLEADERAGTLRHFLEPEVVEFDFAE